MEEPGKMDQGLAAILGAVVGGGGALLSAAGVSLLTHRSEMKKLVHQQRHAHREWLREKTSQHVDEFVESLLRWLLEDWSDEHRGQALFSNASIQATRFGHLMTIYAEPGIAAQINEKLDRFVRAESATMSNDYSKVREGPRTKDELIQLLADLMHLETAWIGGTR